MPKILTMEQGTPEWLEARRGVITSTKALNIFDLKKTGEPTAKHDQQIAKIAMERLNSEALPGATGAAMRRGHDFEDAARTAYMIKTMKEVTECGMIMHDKEKWGCSPDGLIEDNGGLEIKVPTDAAKHVAYLQDPQELIEEYGHQMRHSMFIAQWDYIDIASYHPEAPPGLQLATIRMTPPPSWVDYQVKLLKADRKIAALIESLISIQQKAA